MKRFLNKYKMPIIVVALLGLFVLLSVLLKNTDFSGGYSDEVNAWIEATKKDEYVVTVLGQTTCGHCKNYKPVMEEVKEEYGLNLYWFEINLMTSKDYKGLTKTYKLPSYTEATPYTVITKNGKVIDDVQSALGKEALVEFLTNAGVIAES